MKKSKAIISFCICALMILTSVSVLGYMDDVKENNEANKIVYLTFDDGPTENTLEILKILEEENIKATFFVIGELADTNKEILKKVEESGNSICVHTNTHKNENYRSKEIYFKDYDTAYNKLKELLEKEPCNFMRMPGGSSTGVPSKTVLKSIRDELYNRKINYMDWNVSIEDAMGINIPVEKLLCNYRKEMSKKNLDNERIVILMHDGASNSTTPKALPSIIKDLKKNGYKFKTIQDIDENEFINLTEKKLINRYNEEK